MTSRSLLPLFSCSRTWFRRSTASGALESASVWFWQTRQRSSLDRSRTRFSRTGSSWAMASPQKRTSASLTIQFFQKRFDLLFEDLRRHRADALVADHALAVDDVGFGDAVDAVVERDAPGAVVHRGGERVAVARQPWQRVLARILVVQADHRHRARGEARDLGMLDQAGRAPRRPDVEHPDAAEHVLLRENLVGRGEQRQLERRCRLADQRRRHLARVEAQADGEQNDERDEAAERPGESHAAVFTKEGSSLRA